MIKGIFCDFDGVLCCLNRTRAIQTLKPYEENLRLSAEELLNRFFYSNPFFREIDSGEISYQEMLARICSSCWRGDTQDWIELWGKIWESYEINAPLADWLSNLTAHNINLKIVSDNHKGFRMWMSSHPKLQKFEPALVCSAEIGYCKPSLDFFSVCLKNCGINFEDICFIDDSFKNIEGASKIGMQCIHHLSTESTLQKLNKLQLF